ECEEKQSERRDGCYHGGNSPGKRRTRTGSRPLGAQRVSRRRQLRLRTGSQQGPRRSEFQGSWKTKSRRLLEVGGRVIHPWRAHGRVKWHSFPRCQTVEGTDLTICPRTTPDSQYFKSVPRRDFADNAMTTALRYLPT